MSQKYGENLYDEPVITIMRIPPDMSLNPLAVSAEQLKRWAVQQLRGDMKKFSRWTGEDPTKGCVTMGRYGISNGNEWIKIGRKWYTLTTENRRWMKRFNLQNKDLEG